MLFVLLLVDQSYFFSNVDLLHFHVNRYVSFYRKSPLLGF